MTGIVSLFLYTLIITLFFASSRFFSRRLGSSHTMFRSALLGFCLLVGGLVIQPLRPLSIAAVIHSLAGNYLDVFWIMFYFSVSILLYAGLKRTVLLLTFIVILSLFAITGHSNTLYSDLSQDSVYSLKPYTRTLLSQLDSECIITWYRTEPNTISGSLLSRVLELYARENRQHVRLYAKNPRENNSPEFPEQLALQPLESGEYSGILIEYRGSSRLVPILIDHSMAEYELTRSLEKLLHNKPEMPLQMLVLGNPDYGYHHLQIILEHAGFSLHPPENPQETLNENIPLIVIGSRYSDIPVARAIDGFLDRGGSAMFFVSGTEVDISGDWSASAKKEDPVLNLLEDHGITIRNSLLRDKNHYTIIMPELDGDSLLSIPYPYWIRVGDSGFMTNHPVFSGISSLQFYWPSPIEYTGKTAVPLIHSSESTQLVPAPFDTHPFSGIHHEPQHAHGSLPLAIIRDNGSRRIVISDELAVSALTDLTASYDNLMFIANCAEWLSGRETLTVLKRRQSSALTLIRRILP